MAEVPGGEFWESYLDATSGYQVVIEDDGRVAYAYLLDLSHDIVGDVWLYNRCAAPFEPEWASPEKPPFANPSGFIRVDDAILPIDRADDVKVVWTQVPDVKACVYIRGVLAGILLPGAKPGWSLMAAKDGPLARVLLSSHAQSS